MKRCELILGLALACACACGSKPGAQSSDVTDQRDSDEESDSGTTADDDDDTEDASRERTDASVQGHNDGVCEAFEIRSALLSPDMLIVLDRSSSMKNETVDRWDPSVSGIKAFTSALADQIAFGLMAFPGNGGLSDGSGLSCAPGTLEVPMALDNAEPIASTLDQLEVVESTPTAATLQAAHAVFDARPVGDGLVLGPPYVILVTDGEPNCSDGSAFGGNRGGSDQAAVEASIQEIAAMAQSGIQTYVLGYDTQNDPALKNTLDRMAVAGGTGDTAHRPIEDEASLIDALREIAQVALSCDYALEQPPSDPSYVLVTLDGEPLSYGADDGWSLSADGHTLRLSGAACDRLAAGDSALKVQVQCEIVQGI